MDATVRTIGFRLLEEETLIGGSEDQTLSFIINILEKQTNPLKIYHMFWNQTVLKIN